MVDLELREHTEAANATAARTSEPMAPWIVEALREEFLAHGAEELGVGVDALEIVFIPYGIQVDIHVCYFSITVCLESDRNVCRRKAEEEKGNEMDGTSRRKRKGMFYHVLAYTN